MPHIGVLNEGGGAQSAVAQAPVVLPIDNPKCPVRQALGYARVADAMGLVQGLQVRTLFERVGDTVTLHIHFEVLLPRADKQRPPRLHARARASRTRRRRH